jgi:hypothetical protein
VVARVLAQNLVSLFQRGDEKGVGAEGTVLASVADSNSSVAVFRVGFLAYCVGCVISVAW